MTLITGNAPGNDMRFYNERVEASRNFANKVWNASRFIMMNLDEKKLEEPAKDSLHPSDQWILSKCNTLIKDVTENMDKFELGIASVSYTHLWNTTLMKRYIIWKRAKVCLETAGRCMPDTGVTGRNVHIYPLPFIRVWFTDMRGVFFTVNMWSRWLMTAVLQRLSWKKI